MKTNNNQSPIVEMGKQELQQLCAQVAETPFSEPEKQQYKQQFGIADLWNIRRVRRYRVQRRSILS